MMTQDDEVDDNGPDDAICIVWVLNNNFNTIYIKT